MTYGKNSSWWLVFRGRLFNWTEAIIQTYLEWYCLKPYYYAILKALQTVLIWKQFFCSIVGLFGIFITPEESYYYYRPIALKKILIIQRNILTLYLSKSDQLNMIKILLSTFELASKHQCTKVTDLFSLRPGKYSHTIYVLLHFMYNVLLGLLCTRWYSLHGKCSINDDRHWNENASKSCQIVNLKMIVIQGFIFWLDSINICSCPS